MGLASVIIPARNAGGTLAACLDGLANEGVPGEAAELLVVDDASTDCTRAVASRPDVRVLSGAGIGPAAARNLGARSARGEVLIFLDADTMPCRGWLKAMLEPLDDPRIEAVKGRYRSSQRSLVARFAQLEFEEKYARLEQSGCIDFVDTGTAAFRRQVFEAVGGFDESFPAQSAEDVELAFRLAATGAGIAFNPQAVVWHSHAERLRDFLMKKARYGYFRVEVYRRHPGKTMGDAYTPPVMRLQIGLAGLCLVVGVLALWNVAWAGRGLAAALSIFGLTTLPLIKRAGANQRDLAACVPALAFARASIQGFGVAAGVAMLVGRRMRRPVPPHVREAVAATAFGLDVARAIGPTELRAEATDEHLQILGRGGIAAAPHAIEQRLMREQMANVAHQVVQQLVFNRRQLHDLSADGDDLILEANGQVARNEIR